MEKCNVSCLSMMIIRVTWSPSHHWPKPKLQSFKNANILKSLYTFVPRENLIFSSNLPPNILMLMLVSIKILWFVLRHYYLVCPTFCCRTKVQWPPYKTIPATVCDTFGRKTCSFPRSHQVTEASFKLGSPLQYTVTCTTTVNQPPKKPLAIN